jgi:hypothetical protein
MTTEVLDCGIRPARVAHPLLRPCTAAVVVLATVTCPVGARAAGRQLSAADVVERLQSGALTLVGSRVHGNLDLSHRTIRHRFSCRDCIFDGDLNAAKTVFAHDIDLGESTVHGNTEMPGATFKGALRADGSTFEGLLDLRECVALGPVEMSTATFRGPALFGLPPPGRPSFKKPVDFSLATFAQLATFEAATFNASASFTFARFESEAIFAGGESDGPATYIRTVFSGLADFSGRIFTDRARFESTEFSHEADFSQAEFDDTVDFRKSRFRSGGSFLGAQFLNAEGSERENNFQRLRAGGTLDFGLALFDRPANFAQSTSTGTLSFKDATLDTRDALNFDDVSVGALTMSVSSALTAVHNGAARDREKVLDMIESSAKTEGNLGLANDAHYQRQILRSRHHSTPVRALDFVFYRAAAGYFVRPINPLLTLLVLATVITLIRIYLRHRPARPERAEPHRSNSAAGRLQLAARQAPRIVRSFPAEFTDALSSVGPRRTKANTTSRRLETALYRLILACALIGLANSNPTLRQMFDALH